MAIDYKQLRAGNLLFNHKGEVHKVTPWDIWNFECMVTPGAHFDKRLDLWRYIPLDEECFKRFGVYVSFELIAWGVKSGCIRVDITEGIAVILSAGKWKIGIMEDDSARYQIQDERVFEFFHEFQNLYHSLTGTELEIKE